MDSDQAAADNQKEQTGNDAAWLQRVRYAAAEPTSWLLHATTLRQAAHDLWTAGNAHTREPGSELGATVLVQWAADDYTGLCSLYDRAKAILLETMKNVPPLSADYNFG